jgi:hypothetical protein
LPALEGALPAPPEEAEGDGLERQPLRALPWRSYAALSLVVLGPLAFYGLRGATRRPRAQALGGRTEGPVNGPPSSVPPA